MINKLKELVNTGWAIHLFLGECNGEIDVEDFGCTIGDSNCPILKEYDQEDHHGFSKIDMDDYDELYIEDCFYIDKAIDFIYEKCKEKEKHFGEKKWVREK